MLNSKIFENKINFKNILSCQMAKLCKVFEFHSLKNLIKKLLINTYFSPPWPPYSWSNFVWHLLFSVACYILAICKCKLVHLLGYLCTICFPHQHENWWGQWLPLILLLLLCFFFLSLYPQGWAQYLAHSRGASLEYMSLLCISTWFSCQTQDVSKWIHLSFKIISLD